MSWSMELIWKATALACTGFLVDRVLRRSSAAVRDAVWTAVFAALLALPLASALAPRWTAPIITPISIVVRSAPGTQPARVDWLFWIWFAGFTLTLTRLVASHVRIARLIRETRFISLGPGRVQLRESAAETMPFTWGLFAPVVVLPHDSADWPSDVRGAVLEHELAHVKRMDWLRQFVEQVVCVIFWFHPLVWMAARVASRTREQACDDAVLVRGASTREYASHLLEVARRVHPLASTAAMTYCSELEGRLMAILDSNVSRRAPGATSVILISMLAGCVLLPLASVRLSAEEVYRIGNGVTAPTLTYKVEPDYTEEARNAKIDGTVVLGLEVTRDGSPENIKVLKSLDAGLDRKAMEAVKQWRFKPATKDKKPVRVAATIEVNFRLQ